MKYSVLLLFVKGVIGGGLIWVGVDDSLLSPTVSVDRGHITTEIQIKEMINTKGAKIQRSEVKNDSSKQAVYFPLNLITCTKKEIEEQNPHVRVNVQEDGRKTLKIETLRTEIPEIYVYGQYIKKKIDAVKKSGEIVDTIYLSARGYESAESRKRIAEAVTNSVMAANVKVIPDGTALALQHIASEEKERYVQTYVFRGEKVVASLYKFDCPKKEEKGKKVLSALYHEVYEIYSENQILEVVSGYVMKEVRRIVEAQKPEIKKILFYPRISSSKKKEEEIAEETTEISRSEEKYTYNILELVNAAILVLNNMSVAESVFIEFTEIVLVDGKGDNKTIVPKRGEMRHRVDLTSLREEIWRYIEDRHESVQKMVEAVSKRSREKHEKRVKKKKESGEMAEMDVEEIVYNDIFSPNVFRKRLEGVAGLENAFYAKKTQVTEGGLHALHWNIEVRDKQMESMTREQRAPMYVINGEKQALTVVEALLNDEAEVEKVLEQVLTDEMSKEDREKAFRNFTAEETEEITEKAKNAFESAGVPLKAFSGSAKMTELIDAYILKRNEAGRREEERAGLERSIDRLLKLVDEAEHACMKAHGEFPKQAEELTSIIKKVAEEIEEIRKKPITKEISRKIDQIKNTIGYRTHSLNNLYYEKMVKKEEEKRVVNGNGESDRNGNGDKNDDDKRDNCHKDNDDKNDNGDRMDNADKNDGTSGNPDGNTVGAERPNIIAPIEERAANEENFEHSGIDMQKNNEYFENKEENTIGQKPQEESILNDKAVFQTDL